MQIHNRYDFVTLDHLHLSWQITEDGSGILAGHLPLPAIGPGESAPVEVPCTIPLPIPGAIYHLTLRFTLARATAWADVGHEVAFSQIEIGILKPVVGRRRAQDAAPLAVREEGTRLQVQGGEMEVSFDKARGFNWSQPYEATACVTAHVRLAFGDSGVDYCAIPLFPGEHSDFRQRHCLSHL